jgi:hypothetical protein
MFVSTLIDLTTIVQIKLIGRSTQKTRRNMRVNIGSFLQRARCLSSLIIDYDSCIYNSWTADSICSMVPSHVKHLAVSIKNLDEIRLVLRRFQHLSSVQFKFAHTLDKGITQWMKENMTGSNYKAEYCSVCVWFGKNTIESKERKCGNKRIKLTPLP